MEEWKEVLATWRGEQAFLGENTSGGYVKMGSLGEELGLRPMELLLLGLAGCTGIDVVSILNKQRQNLQELKIRVRGKRAEQHPRVYTLIEVNYLLWGEDLDANAVARAIKLSEEKYCSASAMLSAVAEIQSSFEIFQPRALENPPK
jgi:putative redox protein